MNKNKLSKADQAEMQKCKDFPAYFYNKYVRKKGIPVLTEAQFEEHKKMVEYYLNNPRIHKNMIGKYPLTTDESFK